MQAAQSVEISTYWSNPYGSHRSRTDRLKTMADTPRDADDGRTTMEQKSSPPETQRPIVVPLGAHQMLRDEFTCPITRQLMRQPVIAADGHT